MSPRKTTNKQKISCAVLILSLPLPAFAYIDPGTGSLALQFLIAGAVAIAFTVKTYYYAIRSKIRSLLGREEPANREVTSDDQPTDKTQDTSS